MTETVTFDKVKKGVQDMTHNLAECSSESVRTEAQRQSSEGKKYHIPARLVKFVAELKDFQWSILTIILGT